jgi:hypothetical protein
MDAEKYSCYEFEVMRDDDVWVYVIFDPNYKPSLQTIIRESDEWFDTEEEAREGAKDHINALESGER